MNVPDLEDVLDTADLLFDRDALEDAIEAMADEIADDYGDDARPRGQLAVAQSEQQRGEQLAEGEVARASEDDEVGGLERRGHVHGR
mgnify:CR=1 FL=1